MLKYLWLILLCPCLCWGRTRASLVADVKSGYVLTASEADTEIYPASLTKLMTLYLTFAGLRAGIIGFDDTLYISKRALSQPKSKIYIDTKKPLTVREAVMALIVKSANDVAVVLAENLAPSEKDFALLMTKTAQRLGMTHTTFRNASGLHHSKQISNARDMAVLALALLNHFPEYYPLFKTKFYNIQDKVYGNHNNVIHFYKGAEGLKTGYLNACGYHVITTCTRGDNHIVALSLGQNSIKERDKSVRVLMDEGFKKMEKLKQNHNTAFEKNALLNQPDLSDILPTMKQRFAALHPSKVFLSQTPVPAKIPFQKINEQETDSAQKAENAVSLEENTYWQAQAGAYSSLAKALKKAEELEHLLKDEGSVQILPYRNVYRVRIFDLENRKKADEVCGLLKKNELPCFVIAPKN